MQSCLPFVEIRLYLKDVSNSLIVISRQDTFLLAAYTRSMRLMHASVAIYWS